VGNIYNVLTLDKRMIYIPSRSKQNSMIFHHIVITVHNLFFVSVVLGIKPKALGTLGKQSTTELYPSTNVRIYVSLPYMYIFMPVLIAVSL
jgi:hypothetical protein